MYKRGKKLCSTPVNVGSGSTTLSLSDINPNSSDSAPLASAFPGKRLKRVNVDRKKRKRKRKPGKFKELLRKVRGRKLMESHASHNEWEVEDSLINCPDNKYEAPPPLFESPEFQRDLGVEKDYVLSPPLIGPRGRNLHAIEDEIFGEEEGKHILSLDESKIETNNISPAFERSKVVKTYPSMKKENSEERLLRNKGSGDWLMDAKLPTATAELLWKHFIQDHRDELQQLQLNDVEKDDSRDERNDQDNDTDNDDTLVFLNEKRGELSKTEKLCKIKGHCSKSNEAFPVEVQQYVKVNGQWKRDKLADISSISPIDSDLQDENGTLISFNEFHARSKRKRNEETNCPSLKTSNIKIKSVVKLNAVVYKRLDNNFGISLDIKN